MFWQLSPCMSASTLQGALDTVELIHLPLCHLALMPTSSHSSQEQWQIGTLFLPLPEPSSLLLTVAERSRDTAAVTSDHPSLDTH